MRTVNSKIHGVLDYTISAALFFSPWLFGFEYFSAASAVTMISGAFILTMSLFTNYDLSLYKLFDFTTHRNVMLMFGVFIGCSPWLLNFMHYTTVPHLILGIILVFVALCESLRPYGNSYSNAVHE